MEYLSKKLVICRGSLIEGFTLNWFNNTTKHLKDSYDFIFTLEANEDFPELFKYIQDNNDLKFLKIQEVKDERNIL